MTAFYRKKAYRTGDIVKIRYWTGADPIPDGLPDGISVKVVGCDNGSNDVEFEGKVFRVSKTCIDSGLEHWVDGKWTDAIT